MLLFKEDIIKRCESLKVNYEFIFFVKSLNVLLSKDSLLLILFPKLFSLEQLRKMQLTRTTK